MVRFKIGGNLRFLSHAETLRVFARALARAGVAVRHSEGFNPRPRLSLPLPRSVGVEADDELLCVLVRDQPSEVGMIEESLSAQLPAGIELLSVRLSRARAARPTSAEYFVPVKRECLAEELRDRVGELMGAESIVVRRRADARGRSFKDVDVRGYVRSMEVGDEGVSVECEIASAGSIRVEEILEILGLDAGKLAHPVRRTRVRWREN